MKCIVVIAALAFQCSLTEGKHAWAESNLGVAQSTQTIAEVGLRVAKNERGVTNCGSSNAAVRPKCV